MFLSPIGAQKIISECNGELKIFPRSWGWRPDVQDRSQHQAQHCL